MATEDEGEAALASLWDQIRDGLARAVIDNRSPWRTPVLATADAAGRPKARMVVLRAAERTPLRLVVHSDVRAGKVADLAQRPEASLVFWDPNSRLQAIIEARAALMDAAACHEAFEGLSGGAQRVYQCDPAPGTPIETARAYALDRTEHTFQAIAFAASRIDALSLDEVGHRRAQFEVAADGSVAARRWVAP